MSAGDSPILVFSVSDRRFGLRTSAVESVVRMVDVAPLPKAPGAVCGVIDVAGEIVPVFSIRRRFSMPERDFRVSDLIVLARTRMRKVALAAEEVLDVVKPKEETESSPDDVGIPAAPVSGVVRTPDGLILITDLDAFLSAADEKQLEEALRDRD